MYILSTNIQITLFISKSVFLSAPFLYSILHHKKLHGQKTDKPPLHKTLIHKIESSVANRHYKTDAYHRRPERRTSIRHKQKRNSCNRHKSHNHSDIFYKMEKEHSQNSCRNVRAIFNRSCPYNINHS